MGGGGGSVGVRTTLGAGRGGGSTGGFGAVAAWGGTKVGGAGIGLVVATGAAAVEGAGKGGTSAAMAGGAGEAGLGAAVSAGARNRSTSFWRVATRDARSSRSPSRRLRRSDRSCPLIKAKRAIPNASRPSSILETEPTRSGDPRIGDGGYELRLNTNLW